jgi:glycosyltransferase involved in cell wall biosynthesis
VLIPCLNEAAAIGSVVRGFKRALPRAAIYVYDNGSSDGTAAAAKKAGATVGREPERGKGNVIRRMFSEIEADIYVLVDGDGTYNPSDVKSMVARLEADRLDMVVATREAKEGSGAYRSGHRSGGRLLTQVVGYLFGHPLADMLSGYRVFSRRFVKSFPALTTGFEIETELTIHALELHLPIGEMPSAYGARGKNSASKLHTVRDGIRILRTILLLFQEIRPLVFYGLLGLAAMVLSWGLALPVIREFLETGLVPRFPTAILALGLQLLGVILLAIGIIMRAVARGRREAKRLHYLNAGRQKELSA